MYENRVVAALTGLKNMELVEEDNFVISLRSFQGGIEYAHYQGIISAAYTIPRLDGNNSMQYVRFDGTNRAGEIKSEYKFTGNLVKILSQLDTFVDTTITNRRPVSGIGSTRRNYRGLSALGYP